MVRKALPTRRGVPGAIAAAAGLDALPRIGTGRRIALDAGKDTAARADPFAEGGRMADPARAVTARGESAP